VCEDGGKMEEIMIPSVYKYLIAELGSVNLSIKLKPASV
jgi:DNA-directed RNA polymerase beta subunit